jgi:hypothetical protein
MKNLKTFKEFVNESKMITITEGVEEQIKKEVISKLSDFFGCSPGNLSKFNFDGKDNIKELTKALRSTSDEGTAQYYRVAIQMAKRDLGIHESIVNEKAMDTKYWIGYHDQGMSYAADEFKIKSKDFEDTFEEAVDDWNAEADGDENKIKGAQVKKIEKMAIEFFKIEKWISVNIIQAMIMQES